MSYQIVDRGNLLGVERDGIEVKFYRYTPGRISEFQRAHNMATGFIDGITSPHSESVRTVRDLQGALGTEEEGAALVEVARNAHRAEQAHAADRVRQDITDVVTVVAGLNDALKYLIRANGGGAMTEKAEEKRRGAERRIFRIVERY